MTNRGIHNGHIDVIRMVPMRNAGQRLRAENNGDADVCRVTADSGHELRFKRLSAD